MVTQRNKTERINISLNPDNVKKAKALQVDMVGSSNLSALVDKLLENWIRETNAWFGLMKEDKINTQLKGKMRRSMDVPE